MLRFACVFVAVSAVLGWAQSPRYPIVPGGGEGEFSGDAVSLRGISIASPLSPTDGCAVTYNLANTRFECDAGTAGGIASINEDTATAHVIQSGSTCSDFGIETTGGTTTICIPTASASARGLLSSGDWSAFDGKEDVLTFTAPIVRAVNAISLSGITGFGTANQMLGMNAGANGMEWKTMTAGANMTITHDTNTITFASSGGAGGYATVQEEGSGLTQRSTLNFIGTGVTCADDAGNSTTDCTFTGGGGAVDSVFTRTGAVVAVAGDYEASEVTNTPAGNIAATTVQAAVDELDDEKLQDSGANGVLRRTSAGVTAVVTGTATDCVLVNGTSGECAAGTTYVGGASGAIDVTGNEIDVLDTVVPFLAEDNAYTGHATYTPSTAQAITAVGNAIVANRVNVQIDPSSSLTLTSTPTIADAADGQLLTICNVDTALTVTIQDEAVLAASNLRLGGTNLAVGPRVCKDLVFNGTLSAWVLKSGGAGGSGIVASDSPTWTGTHSYPGSTAQAVSAASQVFCNRSSIQVVASAAVTLTRNPIIADGADGQVCIITNTDGTGDIITFSDGDAFNLDLGGSNLALPAGQAMPLMWSAVLSNWVYMGERAGAAAVQSYTFPFEPAICRSGVAALQMSAPTTNPAVAACVEGTNAVYGVAQFVDGAATKTLQGHLTIPAGTTPTLTARFMWRTSATTGSAVWQMSTACSQGIFPGESSDPAWNAANNTVEDSAGAAGANNLNFAQITLSTTGCATSDELFFRIFRDPAHASDNLAATAELIKLAIRIE